VIQKVKAIFKLRGNRDREELAHCTVLTMPLKSSAICSTALCLQSSGSNEGENVDAPLQSKRQSMEWRHPSSPAKKKFKRQPSAKKIMLTLFWDMHGPILVHFQAHGQTVNSANYCAMLRNELKPAICKKRRGILSK
jgi:heme/copper-type cytochrome/quinol oxidase subunit 1